jgi:large subunit ribosomal protein L24
MNVKKGDTVFVIAGNYKGKTGKVLHVITDKNRLIVEGVNIMKRHSRPTQSNPKGGIISRETSIHRSNVKPYCSSCNSPTRVSHKVIEEKGHKAKVRVCRLCGAEL